MKELLAWLLLCGAVVAFLAFRAGVCEGVELCRQSGHCLRWRSRAKRRSSVGVLPFCFWCGEATRDDERCTVIHCSVDGHPELALHISVHEERCLTRTLNTFSEMVPHDD